MSFAFTPARQKIYEYILGFKRRHDGNSPSIRQIADAFGLSVSIVHDHLGRLEAIGLIKRGPKGESRMINVVGAKWTEPVSIVVLNDADARKLLEVVKG